MDIIFLRGMKAETLIGVYDWEREQLQTLIFDLEIGVPLGTGCNDQIDDTIHYGDVCDAIRVNLKSQRFLLLEALAEHVAELVLREFGALSIKVSVVKPGILEGVREVGVQIFRRCEQGNNDGVPD